MHHHYGMLHFLGSSSSQLPARGQRLTDEPVSGIKIIIRFCDGETMERLFKDTAFFQVKEIETT